MPSFTRMIENKIRKIPENEIIIASKLHKEELNEIPETIFYKALQRMSESKNLIHVTKGIYVRPCVTKFGVVPLSEQDIMDYFTRDSHGVSVGYELYNKKGITTQMPSKYKVYSDVVNDDTKTIKNVEIKRVSFEITKERKEAIELLEILQNFDDIEDGNTDMLGEYIADALKRYNEESVRFVLDNHRYKKSTIAMLVAFLEYFGIINSLGEYLSPLSTYKTINVRSVYEPSQV